RAAPSMVARFNYPGSGVHNFCSDPSGTYLYAGDEIGSGQWYRIFDVRDPQNVEQVGEIIIDAGSTSHNCHTKDGLLYIAHYDRGVWVYDIAVDPVNPELVGYYETGVSNFGIWTVNPHLPSGKIVASDGSNGLLVLEIDTMPIANEPAPEVPAGVTLAPATPNPFGNATTLRFSLDAAAEARLAVYDARGREVAVLVDGPLAAGTHEATLRAADLPSGVYLVRLDAAGRTLTQRVTLLR
ncbi:MAG TPA: T9SS type A sorting domain-containing protein, partial [Rubricoccaceae bacterium]|nr:T9SS type A sorting domain-containing protein [Rubricoccaceae bacterium]